MQDLASIIAVVAALIAALSAIYARWQAKAAQRANELALHDRRLSVYSGLARFRAHISARGTGITEEETWKLAEIAELSEFYYPAGIASRLNAVLEDALKLLTLHEEWKEAQAAEPERARTLVRPRHELMRGTRDECYKLTTELKTFLRVGEA